ncbi:MAG: ATP synthase subunit I [Enterovibrio sp.]
MIATPIVKGRHLAVQSMLIQLGVVVTISMLMSFFVSLEWGIAAFVGGAIYLVANGVFFFCAFLFSGARAAKKVVASFFFGEILKIVLIASLFALTFRYTKVEIFPLTLTFLLTLTGNLFAPVCLSTVKK